MTSCSPTLPPSVHTNSPIHHRLIDDATRTPAPSVPMNSLPPIGHQVIDLPTRTLPPFVPTNSTPPIGHLIIDIPAGITPPPPVHMNNPLVPHRVIDIPTEPTVLQALVERGFKLHDLIPAFLTISFTLIATSPHSIDPDGVILYAIEPLLSLVSAVVIIGLIFYYCWSRNDPGYELPMVQETVMGFSAVLLVLAALSRSVLMFPRWLLLPMVAVVVILIGLLFLLLCFIWYRKSKRHEN